MATLEPVKKIRLSSAVTVQLTRLILSGQYRKGDRLPPERDLANRLSVTRTSLRESLRKMEDMGLLSIRPGDGVYVEDYRTNATLDFVRFTLAEGVELDRELILSIEEVRRIFAVKMIKIAAERIDSVSVRALRDVLDRYPHHAPGDLLSGEWDFLFYHEIAKATGNRLLVYMLNSIKDVFVQLRWLYSRFDAFSDSVVELNGLVLDALEAGDAPRAVSLVEERMKRDSDMLSRLMDAAGIDSVSMESLSAQLPSAEPEQPA